MKAIDSLDDAKINKAIHVAAYEKTRYFVERIARTETSRAWNPECFEDGPRIPTVLLSNGNYLQLIL